MTRDDETRFEPRLGRSRGRLAMAYDALGDVISLTDPNGNVTTSSYDPDRRLIGVTAPPAPLVLVTGFTYDANGQLLETRQSTNGAVLATTSLSYTPSGKLATATDADGNATLYGYDAADRLAQVTDAAGRVTTYAYDAMSRRIALSNPGIQANPLTRWAYTPDGLPASLTIARSNSVADTTNFAYDGFDRLAVTSFPDSSSASLTYDANGNVLTRQTRRGDTIGFAYDTLNRVCTKTYAASPVACGGSSANYLVSYGYDLAGRLASVGDNSAALTAPSSTASYAVTTSYDALNRPLAVGWSPAAIQSAPTASAVTFKHGYDPTNRRISQTATDNSWWSYPPNPSTTTIAYTANNLNQYSAVGAVSPTYDGNGNLTYDGVFTYGYDAESRLVSVKQGSTTVATYAYDAQGRRKSKTVGSTTTNYVTDADNREVLEYDGTSGALGRWYAYGIGPDTVLNQMNVAPGTRETMIPDLRGSIIAMLDSGGTLAKTGYQPFGENPTLTAGTFQYTARRFDPETAGSTSQPSGLYYYRARTYSPTWGRFLQTDPLGYAAGANLYAYVNNDPLNLVDPTGQLSVGGVLNFTLGAGEVGIGVGFGTVTSWTGAGAVAGGVFAVHGADVALAAIRGTDTFTSQALQSARLSQNTSNAISTGITGAAYIAAGAQILPYSLVGSPLAGGTGGTSLLSMTARGYVMEGLQVGNGSSNAVLDALQTLTGTGTNAAAVGRAASAASSVLGYGLEGSAAIQGGVIGQAQGAESGTTQGAGK